MRALLHQSRNTLAFCPRMSLLVVVEPRIHRLGNWYASMYNPASFELHHHEYMLGPKQPFIHNGKVAGSHIKSLILQESCPSLTRRLRFPVFGHVFLDGAITQCNPHLEQLTLNSLCSPQNILPGHFSDGIFSLPSDFRCQ